MTMMEQFLVASRSGTNADLMKVNQALKEGATLIQILPSDEYGNVLYVLDMSEHNARF